MYLACISHVSSMSPTYQIHLSLDAFEIHVSHHVFRMFRMYPTCILITLADTCICNQFQLCSINSMIRLRYTSGYIRIRVSFRIHAGYIRIRILITNPPKLDNPPCPLAPPHPTATTAHAAHASRHAAHASRSTVNSAIYRDTRPQGCGAHGHGACRPSLIPEVQKSMQIKSSFSFRYSVYYTFVFFFFFTRLCIHAAKGTCETSNE